MTAQALRAKLAALLTAQLGTYTTPSGTTPAVWIGDPPTDWTVTGLEAIIEPDPDLDNIPLKGQHSAVLAARTVRLALHGPGYLEPAARRVLQAFPDAAVTRIPAVLQHGILSQVRIDIPT
jgi:hypothetical protein